MSNVAVITARIIVINLLLFDTFSTITAFQQTQTVLLTSLNLFSFYYNNNNNNNNNNTGGNDIALLETAAEFIDRYQHRAKAQWSRPRDSVPDSSISSHCPKTGEHIPLPRIIGINDFTSTPTSEDKTSKNSTSSTSSTNSTNSTNSTRSLYTQLPMLASNCPGWICYAEKTHPEAIPYISTCRSPQQIVGRALKGFWLPVRSKLKNEILIIVSLLK